MVYQHRQGGLSHADIFADKEGGGQFSADVFYRQLFRLFQNDYITSLKSKKISFFEVFKMLPILNVF